MKHIQNFQELNEEESARKPTLASLKKELKYYKDTEAFFRNATGTKNDLENADMYKKYADDKQAELDAFLKNKKK